MFSGLHRKVGIVFTLSKAINSDFWTQSALTHTAVPQCSAKPDWHSVTVPGKDRTVCSLLHWLPRNDKTFARTGAEYSSGSDFFSGSMWGPDRAVISRSERDTNWG